MRALVAGLAADPPVDVGRDEAAEAARRELGRGVYGTGIGERLSELAGRASRRLADLVGGVAGHGDTAPWVAAVVVLAAVAAVGVGLWRFGPPARRRRARARDVAAANPVVDAAGHRRAAARAAEAGDWAVAVRERFRAVTRELEERGVLVPVPGRTAVEIAEDAAAVRPGLGSVLRPAAEALGAVAYSSRPAGPGDLQVVAVADDAVRAVRFDTAEAAPGVAAGVR